MPLSAATFFRLRESSFIRFFWPKAMPDDVLSQMFAKAFNWTFSLVLPIGFVYYFFLADSLLLNEVLVKIGNLTSSLLKRPRAAEGVSHPLASIVIFMPIALTSSWIAYGRYGRQISNQLLRRMRNVLFLWLGLPLLWALIFLGEDLMRSKAMNFLHLIELLALAYVFGHISILFVRSFMVLLYTYGFSRNRR